MRKSSAGRRIFRSSGVALFGVSVCFSFALAWVAAAQTTMNGSGMLLESSAPAGRSWISQAGANPGAVTLATHASNSFAPTVNPNFPAQTAAFAGNDSISLSTTPIFPEDALTDGSGFAGEVTPISEAGTWLAAALGAGFLLYRSRKRLTAWACKHRRLLFPTGRWANFGIPDSPRVKHMISF